MVNYLRVNFLRAVRLVGLAAGKEVLLIAYWDGSDEAKGAAVYCRWLRKDGECEVCLLT